MARLLIAGLLGAAAITPLLAQPVPAPMTAMNARAPMAPTIRADVPVRVQAQFAKRDANRDGYLTAEELTRQGSRHGQRTMMRRGQRGPNGSSGGGAMAMSDPAVAFDRIDANRDGTISRDEFAAGRQVRIEQRVVMNQAGQHGQPKGMRTMRRGGGGGGGMMGAALLKRADTNRDGRVTLAEATGSALQRFDMIDANRDGRITPDERAAGRAAMRQMRRAG